MALTRFLLDGGTNQQAARKLLPTEGLLRRVVNLRLRRDNELGVRPGFTALDMREYGGGGSNMVVCDLMSYDDRLFALGRIFGPSSTNRIVLFEYVGAVKGWARLTARLPDSTRLREIGGVPDQAGGVAAATVAAYNGTCVLAYELNPPDIGRAYALAFRASDNAALAFDTLSGTGAVMVSVGPTGLFFIATLDFTTTRVEVRRFAANTNENFGAVGSTTTVDTTVFAMCAVTGTTAGYVVVGCLAGNIVVKHFNNSFVQQMTRTINTIVPRYLAVSADSTSNIILIGFLDDADDLLKYKTISLTAGTDIAGPTTLSASTTDGIISVYVDDSSNLYLAGNITSTTPRKVVFDLDGDTFSWFDAQLTSEIRPEISALGVSFAQFIQGNAAGTNGGVTALASRDTSSAIPQWFKDFGTSMEWPARVGSCVRDAVTGKFYSVNLRQNNDLLGGIAVNEWDYGVAERRQVACQGGLLHVAGALPLTFDGRIPFENSWGGRPVIYSLASSNTTGAIASSAEYFIQAFPEVLDARGNVHRGPPSEVYSITTGAADDTITGSVSSLHSFRNAGWYDGGSYRIVICRTAALADKTAGENLYRETYVSPLANSTGTAFGTALNFTLLASDDALRALGETQGTIYTQGQTPIAHQAPPPCSYLWPTNERLAIGGLPRTNQWLQSKLKFPAEGTHFSDSDLPQYQGSADEAILAVASIQGQLVIWTRRTISLWTGTGPDHSGQGEFTFSGFLSREGGINGADGWKSLVETDAGIFFQRDDEQLCFLSDRGEVDWTVGQAIRDELVTYPVVLAACYLRKQNAVAFAVENAAANAGEILVYDLRRKAWFIDDVYAKALTEYQGRLCYADSNGAVFQQHAAPGTGTMPNQSFETFDFDFGTGMSWGEIVKVGVVGTKVADCTATLDITFDSGLSYTTIETFTLTTAGGYAANGPVNLEKAPPIRDCSRFGLRFNVTGGSGTEGIRINEITLETTTAPGMARLPARDTH